MPSLTMANQGRLRKCLDKQYRFSGVIMTLEQYLDGNQFTVVDRDEQKYEYNRRKFNGMDYREQAEYERKLEERVTRYYAMFTDGTLLQIPKIVADHYREEA